MPIPSGGLIHKYDLLDPASYPGSGTVITDTVGSLDLDITGSPTFDSTLGSLTWNGNGIGAYSTIGQYANITTTFTVSIWIKINDASVTQLVFNNGNRVGSMSGYSSFFDGPTSDLIDFGGNNVWGMASGSALAQDQWYNLTYTLDSGANQGKIYINGVLSATSSNGVGNAYGVSDFLALGGTGSSTGSPTLQNKASYAVVLLYNTTLNGTQVLDIYDTYFARFNPAIHAYDAADPASYPGSGSTLSDIGTATAIDLTINDATFDSVNDSFTLDGTLSSYIRSANSLAGFDIGANDFSIQYWFKYNGLTAQPPYNIFLQIGSRTGPSSYSGFTNFTFNGELNIGKPGVADYATGFNPVIGTWYQVTMTVNSSNLVTLYIDGVSTYSQTISFVTPDNIIAMGDNGIQTDQVANASMGPLFIYDRVLSGTEITDYYNSTVTRFFPPAPPVAGNLGGRTFGQGFAG